MMDDEDKKSYPGNLYSMNYPKLSGENDGRSQNFTKYDGGDDDLEDDDDDDGANNEEEEEEGDDDEDDDDDQTGVQRISKDDYELGSYDDDYADMHKHPKKRKLKTLLSNYEFAPRAPAPSASVSFQKPSQGNSTPDWTERETFILLTVWGQRFLKHGRKSLHSEEWQEVAEKVTHESKIERTDAQCRSHLDTLKKKYKKEKMKSSTTWVYFTKMDDLLQATPQQTGLPCGVDSGEFIFMNPKAYLDCSNGLDEMCDSPENSETTEGGEDDMEYSSSPQKANKGPSFKLLADSIHKFNEIYQKIENSKRQQMLELEKMRMNMHRDLELQRKQILERAQAEIQKIREGDDDDIEVSGDNLSG